ncbi:hypothetical protein N7488_010890 [Penicillium malachiteum]|nr:hypothetical protein N7488_010890 [Penicillium malachiteum]
MVSTRENKTKHLTNLLSNGALTSTSELEAFRDFFDIKTEHWHAFRQHLTKKIEEVPSWIELQNPVHRLTCAKVFLGDHGHQYWGNEDNRAKYLLTDRVMHDDCCFFPENEKAYAAPSSYPLMVN